MYASLFIPASASGLKIEDVRVQLFYENSGTLSEDLTKMKNVALWNTIIGEGDAREPANSFLVNVVLSGKAGSFDHTEKLVVTVFDETIKKSVVQKTFSSFLIEKSGRVIKPVFVENRTCSPIRITAKSKNSTRTIRLSFDCGE